MLKTLALGASALMLCGPLSAQTYDELPAGFTKTVDMNYDWYLLPRQNILPVHLQYSYDLSEIATSGSPILQALSWRRNNYYGNPVPAGSVTMVASLGYSTATPSSMSTTFATNNAIGKVQIFKGTISYPAAVKGTGPAPWTHVLKIVRPIIFVIQKGTNKSLTLDMAISASTGYTTATYTMEAAAPDIGNRFNNGSPPSKCLFSNSTATSKKYANSLGYSRPPMVSPGSWYVRYSGILPNAPGIMTISGFGLDNKGAWPLPLHLTGLGAPNCYWHVGLETGLWIPIAANASGSATVPTLQIPAGFGGSSFYDQSLWLDQKANKLGFVVGWSSKWYIGTGKAPSASTLYRTKDTTTSPTGSLKRGYAPHLRLTR